MSATAVSSTPSAPTTRGRDRSRLLSAWSAVLFLPGLLAAAVLAVNSERASARVASGENCVPGLPAELFNWSVCLGGLACAVALIAPVVPVRRVALAAQITAEGAALLQILSYR